MPVKGLKEVKSETTRLAEKITGPMARRTLQTVMELGATYASLLTPVDTSLLIGSRFVRIVDGANGPKGMVGYTAAYAAAVHRASGKLKGRPRGHFGTTKAGKSFGGGTGKGRYWDPSAEPGFLRKGFERDGKADIASAIAAGMKL